MAFETITLEDSDGKLLENPSEQQLLSTLARIGDGLDHCILDLGNAGFLQAAGGRDRLLLQYRDGSGMYESARSDFDAATLGRVFLDAMNGKTQWKTDYAFSLMEEAEPAEGGRAPAGGASGSFEGRERSVKDRLFDSVEKETGAGLLNLIVKGIRSLLGK